MLDSTLRLKKSPRFRFAGQITGVEGYVESSAIGLLAGKFAAAEKLNKSFDLKSIRPPETTAHGALLSYITEGAKAETFQPMNINFGLLPAANENGLTNIPKKLQKKEKRKLISERALFDLGLWKTTYQNFFN